MENTMEEQSTQPERGMEKRKIALYGAIGLAVIAGLILFYFFYLENPSRQVLAQVNDEKITLKQFNKELEKMENPLRDMYREEPNQFLEGIIVKTLLLQEAKKQGLSTPVKTYKDAAKDSKSPEEILIGELMKKKFSSPPAVTPEEIKTFYSLFKDRLGGKPLDQVAPEIEQVIREGKEEEEWKSYIGELRNAAKVGINQIQLQKIAAKPPESNTEEDFKKALAGGMPFLVDFGANSCIPCRQMRPILKEIDKEYSGKTRVLVIDIYKNQNLAKEYKIVVIPTLVFFDSKGKEVFRQMGIMEKEKIVAKLKEIGMSA